MHPIEARPRRRSTAHPIELDGHLVVVDLGAMQAHLLNVSAWAVFQTCDSARTRAQIVEAVASQFLTTVEAIDGDVRMTISHLAQIGLVEIDDQPRASCDDAPVIERRADGVSYYGVDPSPCQRVVDEMGWTHRTTLAVGEFHVGVRSMSAPVADLITDSFATSVVDDDQAPANFSVLVDRPADRSGRGPSRHGVFDAHRWCGATPGDDGVIGVLARRLHALEPLAAGAVRIDAPLARGPHGVIVLVGYGPSARFSALRGRGLEIEAGPVVLAPTPAGWMASARPARGLSIATTSAAPLERPEPVLGVLVAGAGGDPAAPALGLPALGLSLLVPYLRAAPADDRAALVDAAARLVGDVGVHRSARRDLPLTVAASMGAAAS